MYAVESVIVVGGGAEVVGVHLIVGLLVDTALRKHRYWQRIGVVGVGVKPRVAVAHGGVGHGAVSQRLVAVVGDDVLLHGSGILNRTERRELKPGDGAIL